MVRLVLAAALLAAACAAPTAPYGAVDDRPGIHPPATTVETFSAPPGVPPYRRYYFGNGWDRVHGNCDTREIVLERDAGPAAADTDGDGCRDDSPVRDPYTGRLVDPPHADADHVVSLYDSWVSGAWQWTPAQRHAFAQDITNLRAVGFSINRSKGESSPAAWRPPAHTGWCTYAQTYQTTKLKWRLIITPTQTVAINDMLTTCPKGGKP